MFEHITSGEGQKRRDDNYIRCGRKNDNYLVVMNLLPVYIAKTTLIDAGVGRA